MLKQHLCSKLTREQTLKQVIYDKDYSNFENLDLVMRSLVANNTLAKFVKDYNIGENSDPDTICAQIQYSSRDVTGLLDPPLTAEAVESIKSGEVRAAAFLPGTEGVESLLAKAGFRMEQDGQTASWRLPVADLAGG